MKWRFNKRTTLISYGLAILLMVGYFSSSIFDFRYTAKFVLTFFGFILILAGSLKKIKRLNYFTALFICTLIIVLVNNSDIKNMRPIYEVTYLSLVVIALNYCSKNNKSTNVKWTYTLFNFMYLWGTLCVLFTLLEFFIPSIYTTTILPNISDNSYHQSLMYCFTNGYMPGIAVHYSTNGIFLATFVGIQFADLLYEENKKCWWKKILFITSLFALLLTAKRAHIVFSVISLFIVYYTRQMDNKKKRIFKTIAILIAACIAFAIMAQYFEPFQNFIARFNNSSDSDSLFSSRNVLYTYALSLFVNNPILGIGWGNFKYLANSGIGSYNDVHNVFLQLLTETGVLGFSVFIILFISFLHNSYFGLKRIVFNKKIYDKNEKKIVTLNLYLFIFFILYCITGNPLYDTIMLIPVFVCQIATKQILYREFN